MLTMTRLADEAYDKNNVGLFEMAVLVTLPFQRIEGITLESISKEFGLKTSRRVSFALSNLRDKGYVIHVVQSNQRAIAQRHVWIDPECKRKVDMAGDWYWANELMKGADV